MDPEVRRLLEDIYALTKDNHRMLRAVRRHQVLDTFGKWILWLIVILASAYTYWVYVEPIVQKIETSGFSQVQPSTFFSTTTPIGKLINYFNPGK